MISNSIRNKILNFGGLGAIVLATGITASNAITFAELREAFTLHDFQSQYMFVASAESKEDFLKAREVWVKEAGAVKKTLYYVFNWPAEEAAIALYKNE